MARQGISKEQVYTAAAELREEGTAPTVQAVRERIGSGSFSTINTHLGLTQCHSGKDGFFPVTHRLRRISDHVW
jgi:hypothetical protein